MFLTAKHFHERAFEVLGFPVGGTAVAIPVLSGKEHVRASVFIYVEAPNPKALIQFPPHELLHFDPTTGALVSRRAIEPKEIGPDVPKDRALDRHPDERRVDADEFWRKKNRLLEIFHEAWWSYAQAQVRFTPERRALLAECAALFDEVAEKRLMPWYEGLAGPFLAWLRRVAKAP